MTAKKNNEDMLIKKALITINEELNIDNETPETRLNNFKEKMNVLPTPLWYRMRDTWKAFSALIVTFFTLGFIIARITIPSQPVLQTVSVSPEQYDPSVFEKIDKQLAQAKTRGGNAKQQVANLKFVYPDQYEFNVFDSDDDNYLSLYEAKNVKRALAIKQFYYSDIDSNGKLNFKESTNVMYLLSQSEFVELDNNNDSQLSFLEANQSIASINDELFKKIDRDHDGKLSFTEAQYLFSFNMFDK